MKKCLLLYISLFFFASPLSWSMEYNQDEDGYGQNEDSMSMENGMMQNNMMMQQPNMMPQNGMMMNQGMMQMPPQMPMQNGMMQNNMMQDNMMMQQPGMMPQNGMMMNQMDDPERAMQEDETSKREYVQSLVQNILKVDNRRQNRGGQNGGTVINRDLKNKLLKLQKILNEISRSLDGISVADETSAKGSSKKSKSSASSAKSKSSEGSKSTSGKSKSASKNAKSSRKSGSSRYKKRGKKWSRAHGRNAEYSKYSRPKSFYTVKQLTPRNAIKYVPKFYSSGYAGYGTAANDQQVAPAKATSYKVKNWGTGEITPEETYYYKNSQNSYFLNKSKCENGCGAQ